MKTAYYNPFVSREGTVEDVIQAGKYIFIAMGDQLSIYSYWKYSATQTLDENEPSFHDYSQTEITRYGKNFSQVGYFPTIIAKKLVASGTHVYAIDATGLIHIIEIDTLTQVGTISVPTDIATTAESTSSLFYAADKLWLMSAYKEDDVGIGDKLYFWDLKSTDVNQVWTIKSDSIRRQKVGKRCIEYGYNSFIYVTQYSYGSVFKVDIANGYTSEVPIVESIDKIKFDPKTNCLICSSDNAFLTSYNVSTEEITYIVNTEKVVLDFTTKTSDNCYWYLDFDGNYHKKSADYSTVLKMNEKITGTITEVISPTEYSVSGIPNISYIGGLIGTVPVKSIENGIMKFAEDTVQSFTEDQTFEYSPNKSYSFTKPVTDSTAIAKKLIILPEITVSNKLDDHLINEYLLVVSQGTTRGELRFIRNKRNFYDTSTLTITGQGMIYSGSDIYFGG